LRVLSPQERRQKQEVRQEAMMAQLMMQDPVFPSPVEEGKEGRIL
jgi:hypothetical protein